MKNLIINFWKIILGFGSSLLAFLLAYIITYALLLIGTLGLALIGGNPYELYTKIAIIILFLIINSILLYFVKSPMKYGVIIGYLLILTYLPTIKYIFLR